MRTYYDTPDARVTDEMFAWHNGSATLYFAVPHLRHVGRVQAPAGVRPSVPYLTIGALALATTGWTMFDPPALFAGGVLTVAAPVIAALWRAPRRWELHARYHGADVLLFSSPDERKFNQVSRALRRAIEDTRAAPRGYGLATA